MIRRAIFLVAMVAAPAAFAAGLWQGQAPKGEAAVTGVRINAPLVAKPGHGVADAGRYFAALNAPPPPPPPPPPVLPPPPPPPPDVAVLFRRDLSAVLSSPGAEPRVVLSGSRSLRPGDVYRDGWTLSSVSQTTAVLTKGKEQRSIGLFSPPPASQTQVAAVTAPAAFAPTLTFGNSAPAGRPSSSQIAGVVGALGSAGMNPAQLERISAMMANGTFDQNSASQMLNQLAREGRMNPTQLNNVLQAMQRANVLQPRQVQALSQSLPQMQSMQQMQQVLQMGNRPNTNNNNNNNRGGGGGNRGPNTGFSSSNSTPPPAGRTPTFAPPPPPPRPTVIPPPPPPPARIGAAPATSGVSTINLRNMGEGRTLVTLDGKRLADQSAPSNGGFGTPTPVAKQ